MVTRFLMNVAGGRECNRRDERSVAGKQEHPNQLGDQEASCPQERRWAALHYVWSVSLYLCFRSVLSSIISVMKIISLLGITQINNQLDAKFIIYIFISILYTFRATLCSSSGESIVSIQHLVYVTLCRWPSGMQVGLFIRIRNNTLLYSKHRSQFTNWQTVELKGLGVAKPARRVSRARF